MVNLDSLILMTITLILKLLKFVQIRGGGHSQAFTGLMTLHKWLALNLDIEVSTVNQ